MPLWLETATWHISRCLVGMVVGSQYPYYSFVLVLLMFVVGVVVDLGEGMEVEVERG